MAHRFVKQLAAALYRAQKSKSRSEIAAIAQRALDALRDRYLLSKKDELFAALEEVRRKEEGVIHAHIVSRTGCNPSDRRKIIRYLKARFKKNVEITEQKDPSLIGGFKILWEDTVLDATINNQIKQLAKELTSNDVVRSAG